MSINNGGPAFPVHEIEYAADYGVQNENGTQWFQNTDKGMTLRDYFAAKALPAIYASYVELSKKYEYDGNWKMDMALDSYAVADAMIRAREAS